jgi:hypothetical protein
MTTSPKPTGQVQVAAGRPGGAFEIRAKGNHLAAQNDEPEPTIMGLAAEMQALADRIKASRAQTGTTWPKAFVEAQKRLMQLPAHYQRSCTLCGGTSTGESHRGFVGACTCGVPS